MGFSIFDFILELDRPSAMVFTNPRRTLGLNGFEALRFVFLFWVN